MTPADRPPVTDDARADEVPRLSIEDGHLVARVDRCTCEPHYGAHEIHCGIVDHHRLDNLPGWPGRAETTTATDEDAARVLIGHPSIPNYANRPPGRDYRCPQCPDAMVYGPNSPDHAHHQAQALADAGLLARPTPTREEIIDALVMSPLSDTAGTDLRPFEQTADAVLALLEGGGDE